jgi:3-deoxy-D-manno-octulosonic-acid transferase
MPWAEFSFMMGTMSWLINLAYLVILLLASPFLLLRSWRTGKYRKDLAGRLGHLSPEQQARIDQLPPKRLLLHCVSVGELLSVRVLIEKLQAAQPDLGIIVSTITDTGTQRAREMFPADGPLKHVVPVRYPFDFSWAVNRFLRATAPTAIALIELETWPNFIRAANRKGIPIAIINGRMTQRAFGRYRLIAPVMRGMLHRLAFVAVQTQSIAERFIALGADPAKITVVPTLKYDAAVMTDAIAGKEALAEAMGIGRGQALLVGGSTGPGEEEILLTTYLHLYDRFPHLRLALVPRKPETLPQVLAAIRRLKFEPVLRTACPDGTRRHTLGKDEIVVLDTMGELRKIYALGTINFVGRSLVKLGGSDMIESVAMGRPTCFGPHTFNFAEATALLLDGRGAVLVPNGDSLDIILSHWLEFPAEATATGQRGQAIIAAQRGATAQYVTRLSALLNGSAV